MGIRRRPAPPASLQVPRPSSSATATPSSAHHAPSSPYDNVSIAQSLDESYSLDLELSSSAHHSPSATQPHPSWAGTLGGASGLSVDGAILPHDQLGVAGGSVGGGSMSRRSGREGGGSGDPRRISAMSSAS